MIFIATDILNPYQRDIVSTGSYPALIDFLLDHYPDGFKKPTDISINGNILEVDDYDTVLNESDVVVLLDRAALPVGLIGGWFVTALANLAISVTLSYVANKLFAPDAPSSQASASSVYSINNAQNTARFGSPIPIIYGTVRAYPSMIVQPYYKFENNIEYLYHVLCVGQGTLTTDNILIGNDDTDNTGDVQWKLLNKDSFYNIPLNGYGVHLTKTLASPSTMELKISNGESEKYKISKEAQYVEFDYMYPNGLIYYEGDGEDTSAQTSFVVKIYTISGPSTYSEVYSETVSISARELDPIQRTKRIDVSSYEEVFISFRKATGEATNTYITNTFIKRVKEIHPNEDFTNLYGDVTLLACKIKATNAVSATGQVKVNGYFERTDVGNTMHEVLTDIYTNTTYGGALNESDLSFPLTTETVNCAYDQNMTIFDAMRKPAIAQGYSLYLAGMDVILKKDEPNTIVSGMYNEMNIIKNSLKVQYLFKEEYPNYDGFECTYIDACKWIPVSVKYPATSTRPNKVDLFGVVDYDCLITYNVLDLTITSPVQPEISYPPGGVTYEDNGDGTWRVWSDIENTSSAAVRVLDDYPAVITSITVNSLYTKSCSNMFADCSALESVNLRGLRTADVTSLQAMFFGCKSLVSVDLTVFADGHSATDFSSMFYDCWALEHVNLTGVSTAPGGNFFYMFFRCYSLLCITNIDTTSFYDTGYMFLDCNSLIAPSAADRSAITSGTSWVNGLSCP